ncbi:MAG: hypothetical protein RL557_515 [archaeon]|jgi:putative glycosyltransferase (TIGR04372 family)
MSIAIKLLKKTYNISAQLYENSIAGWLAQWFYLLYYPFYLFYKKNNFCFIVNVAEGVGHIIPELDYFFRLVYLQQIDPNKKYVFLRKRAPLSEGVIKLYSHKFYYSAATRFKYYALLPMLMHYRDITFDAGYCRIKWQTPSNEVSYNLDWKSPFVYQTSKSEGAKRFAKMFYVRQQTKTFFPLHDFHPERSHCFLNTLGLTPRSYCLVHIKQQVCNATAAPTDPNTYLQSLQYLRNQGYRLVFAGREKMPSEFEALGLINYAESAHATFENDILLAKDAKLLISGGSGFNTLGDYFDVPVLYLNSWHLALQFFHRTSVCVPALVKRRHGEFVTFSEQVDLAFADDTERHEIFPDQEYEALNADADDIHQGLLELVTLLQKDMPIDPLYEKFVRTCNRHDLLTYCDSRISTHFLRKYKRLLK